MGNNESVVCGKKNPKKNQNNEEQQLGEPEDEEQVSTFPSFKFTQTFFCIDGRYWWWSSSCQQ